MAVLSALISIGLVIGIIIKVFRIRIDDTIISDTLSFTYNDGLITTQSNRWRALGCLISIFLLTQMLFQFSLIKYFYLGLWIFIGKNFLKVF